MKSLSSVVERNLTEVFFLTFSFTKKLEEFVLWRGFEIWVKKKKSKSYFTEIFIATPVFFTSLLADNIRCYNFLFPVNHLYLSVSDGEQRGPGPPATLGPAHSCSRGGPGFRPAATGQQHRVSEAAGAPPEPVAAAPARHPGRWSPDGEAAQPTPPAGLAAPNPTAEDAVMATS